VRIFGIQKQQISICSRCVVFWDASHAPTLSRAHWDFIASKYEKDSYSVVYQKQRVETGSSLRSSAQAFVCEVNRRRDHKNEDEKRLDVHQSPHEGVASATGLYLCGGRYQMGSHTDPFITVHLKNTFICSQGKSVRWSFQVRQARLREKECPQIFAAQRSS